MQTSFINKWIKFESNSILTRGMLQELYDFPHHLLECHLLDTSAGILAGLTFSEKDGKLWLGKGLIHFQKKVYFLLDDFCLTDLIENSKLTPGDGMYYNIVLIPASKRFSDGVNTVSLDFNIGKENGDNLKIFQICGFFNGLSPILPRPDVEKGDEEYILPSRLQLLDTPWAARESATFHPMVFKAFLHMLTNAAIKTPFAYTMIFELQKSGVLPMSSLIFYIEDMGQKLPENANRKDIFKLMCACVKMEKKRRIEPDFKQEASPGNVQKEPRPVRL